MQGPAGTQFHEQIQFGIALSSEHRQMSIPVIFNKLFEPSPVHSILLESLFVADQERKTEVTLRNLTAAEHAELRAAQHLELDQWMQHSVYSVASRSGVPRNRTMTMRWVLAWKPVPGSDTARNAKARLVVRDFTIRTSNHSGPRLLLSPNIPGTCSARLVPPLSGA